jgi:hypothetical protein
MIPRRTLVLGASAAVTVVVVVVAVGSRVALSRAASRQQPGAPAPAADATAAGGLSAKVKILFMTVPPEKATVFWGKKSIGIIKGKNKPLIIERPRDSGPMDVVIRAQNYLPVHTRAYTFSDSKLYVKITPLEEKSTLFGYREAVPDAGGEPTAAGGGRDAGADR